MADDPGTGATDEAAATVEPPWWGTGSARTPARDRLSRDLIVETALHILDTEGLAAVTIRRLARDLDTGAASLYWHIASKDQLLELVYDRILGEIEFPVPDPTRWADQIREVAHRSYAVFLAHNDAALLSLGTVPFGPNGLVMIEWMLAVLRGAGVPDEIAGFFGDLLGRFIDASVLEETRARDGIQPEQVASMQAYIAALPPDRFPNILAMVPALFGAAPSGGGWEDNAETRFDMGLDLLLTGLAVHVPKP